MRSIAKNAGWLTVLAITLALANLVLWYTTPWMRDLFDAMTGRLASPLRPLIMNGIQELLVYFDPWLARRVFPVVYTLGFIAIAFLFQRAPDLACSISGSAVVSSLLLSLEASGSF